MSDPKCKYCNIVNTLADRGEPLRIVRDTDNVLAYAREFFGNGETRIYVISKHHLEPDKRINFDAQNDTRDNELAKEIMNVCTEVRRIYGTHRTVCKFGVSETPQSGDELFSHALCIVFVDEKIR